MTHLNLPLCAVFAALLVGVTAVDDSVRADDTGDAARAADMFTVPKDADVQTLYKFLVQLRTFRPETQNQYREFLERGPVAFKQAAQRIVKIEKDATTKAHRLASLVLLQIRFEKFLQGTADEQEKFIADVQARLEAAPPGPDELSIAMATVRELEQNRKLKLARDAYASFGKALAKSDKENLAGFGRKMVGAARRLKLKGKPIQFKSVKFDGEPFDFASLKGKVVLVDFWAVWCRDCLAEFPRMRKYYEAYKDRGFEIVGVNMDENRFLLRQYLATRELPWIILSDPNGRGENPLAIEFGVFVIPKMFLVGKDGKVVSIDAGGRNLGPLLEQHLGPLDPDDK